MDKIAERYEKKDSSVDLKYGIIEVTSACQLHCPGCYMVKRKALNKGQMTFKDAVRILDLCKEYRGRKNLETMDILGGEPLLWPYLKDYIEELLQRDIKPWIFTNMIAITPQLAKWLLKRQIYVTGKLNVSQPHWDRWKGDEYEPIYSKPDQLQLQAKMIGRSKHFARSLFHAIDVFLDAGYKTPFFRLQNLIRKKNLPLIPDYIHFCCEHKIGVDLEIMGSGEAVDHNYFKVAPTAQELAKLIQDLENTGKKWQGAPGGGGIFAHAPEFQRPKEMLLMPHLFGSCPFYDKGLYFAVDGHIRACSNSTTTLAHLTDPDPIRKAYESPLICNRKKLTQELVGEPCHSCDRWDRCRGGCRATVEGTGDPFGGYSLCPLPLLK